MKNLRRSEPGDGYLRPSPGPSASCQQQSQPSEKSQKQRLPVEKVTAPAVGSGGHVKTVYQGCKTRYLVVWIEFDALHTPTPKDKGVNKTFTADETWAFFSQFKAT